MASDERSPLIGWTRLLVPGGERPTTSSRSAGKNGYISVVHPSRAAVGIESLPFGAGLSGERVSLGNLDVLVLPSRGNVVANQLQDRAMVIDTPQSRVLLGADGVSGSYSGQIAAAAVVDIASEMIQRDGDDTFFTDASTFESVGNRLKGTQAVVQADLDAEISTGNLGDLEIDVLRDRARVGSSTTFFAVRLRDNRGTYLNVGDGVLEVVTKDGNRNTVLRKRDDTPDQLSTTRGYFGNGNSGTFDLNKGDTLIVGTDGLLPQLDKLVDQIRKGSRDVALERDHDDITVFVYRH